MPVTFAELDGGEYLLQRGVGFWHDLVIRQLPHACIVTLDDRDAYLRIARATDTSIFVTAKSDPFTVGSRRVIPISDFTAHASFYLLVRRDASGPARELSEALGTTG